MTSDCFKSVSDIKAKLREKRTAARNNAETCHREAEEMRRQAQEAHAQAEAYQDALDMLEKIEFPK